MFWVLALPAPQNWPARLTSRWVFAFGDDELPVLENPKHERFAQELAKGTSAEVAHSVAGYRASRSGAWQLKQKLYISNRVAELLSEREAVHSQATAAAIKSAGLSKEWVIETLMENVGRAMQAEAIKDSKGTETGEYRYEGSVANRALELLGKELGMFVDRKEVGKPGEFESMNADQLRDYIRREAAELGLGAAPSAELGASGKPN